MATDMERLVVSLEARVKSFQNDLAKANASAQKNLRGIERQFAATNKKVESSAKQMASSLDIFGRFTGGFGKIAGLAYGANEVRKYADAWTEAGNKVAAASELSGRQARSLGALNDIATETRSGLTETVDLYAKLLRSTKDVAKSEDDVARATEIVNKAFKAGGASANEQAAGILQLSQALGSGVLQGDELRSIRENAPLLAQAIADEFKTTIAGLKDLGAEGKLTSDRVFKAILSAAPQIERAFGKTKATVGDSLTLLGNSLIEVVGRASDASGASEALNQRLAELVKVIETVGAGFEYVAGSPAGKFIGFLNDAVQKLEPLTAALRVLADLSDQDLAGKLGGVLGAGAGDFDEQIARARKELERFFDAAGRGVGKSGGLTKEQGAAIDELRDKLAKSAVTADEAKQAIMDVAAMQPGDASNFLVKRFDELIDQLKVIKKEADAAASAVAIAGLNTDDRATSRADQHDKAASAYVDFIAGRNSEAAQSELDKKIDKRADEIVAAAAKVGVALTEAAAEIQARGEIEAETSVKAASSAAELIKQFESFQSKPYWDVNAYRVGYGSDTTTLSDGTVQRVTKGITVSLEDATRDLERRIADFQSGIKSAIGTDTFNAMSSDQQAALTSIAYNYGSLPERIVEAIKSGNTETVYNAIKGLGTDNGGINAGRRQQEADLYASGATDSVKSSIDFSKSLEDQQKYVAGLQAQTGILSTLNPLVNDYGLKLSTVEAAQQLLNEAQKQGTAAGRELSDVQQLLYGDLSKLSPEAQKQAEAMRALANQTGQAEAASVRLTETQDKLKDRLSDSSAFGKDLLGGFISDLRDGKSAAEALTGVLDKLADKLIDIALTQLFDGGVAGSGGGVLGGLFSMFFAKNGGVYANGKPQPMKTFARGGVSHSAAIFGEAGPEAAVPLPDGRRIPVDLRGPAPATGGGGQSVTINAPISAPGADAAQLARVERSVQELGKNIPKMVDARNREGRVRKTRA